MSEWTPISWRDRRVSQIPAYPSEEEAERVVGQLAHLPPLVTSWEIKALKHQLARATRGEAFLLQGGDCAESFAECSSSFITSKLKILLQMSLVLVQSSKRRIIRVGRFAGQYAKPRSSDVETQNGQELPSYRGDLINALEFTQESRRPDPWRMIRGYEKAALTLNFIRGLIDGGFADLHHPEYWDLGFVQHSPLRDEYRAMVKSIGESLEFLETVVGADVGEIHRVDFFTSHEGLHLPYEQAQTRTVPHHRDGWYNLSTHFPWIGMRTCQVDAAHVEYFRGISNPIGLKVGPGLSPEELIELIEVLNPDNEPGRLTLIHRFGVNTIADGLPPLINAVKARGKTVLWCCDPMHGNTRSTREGYKTRRFDDILSEVEQAFELHAHHGTYLGGIHVELTGEDVTECVGGARGLSEVDLSRAYRSHVDPRLNYEQALELALLVARKMGSMAR